MVIITLFINVSLVHIHLLLSILDPYNLFFIIQIKLFFKLAFFIFFYTFFFKQKFKNHLQEIFAEFNQL